MTSLAVARARSLLARALWAAAAIFASLSARAKRFATVGGTICPLHSAGARGRKKAPATASSPVLPWSLGQAADVPVQLSATSHGSVAGRHASVAGANASAGDAAATPPQSPAPAHAPPARRATGPPPAPPAPGPAPAAPP